MDKIESQNQERSAQAALRTIAGLIRERTSDEACIRDIRFLLELCGVPVEDRPKG